MEEVKRVVIGIIAVGSSVLMNLNDQKITQQNFNFEAHQKFHYPQPTDLKEKVKPIPYLYLPFRKADLEKNPLDNARLYDVSEGWTYSKKELDIHGGDPLHGAVDLHVPYGTSVISPVDGYAMSSYHTFWKRDDQGNIVMYKGKPLRLGLGYFIYIYVPSVNRFVEIAHLSDIDPVIPFSPPVYEEDGFVPTNNVIKISEIKDNPNFVYVKKGMLLGRVGYSGLALGENLDYVEGAARPIIMEEKNFESWDIPHVHFEEFWIDQETGEKGWQRDPYGIYDTFEKYPSYHRKRILGKDFLIILDKENMPQFAG